MSNTRDLADIGASDVAKALADLTGANNKIPRLTGTTTADTLDFLDEDTMTSNSATAVASQQSIKAYVDTEVAAAGSADAEAKAWARFNGNGTAVIDKSYNITSITDEGTGQYIFNFTSAMTDANYAGLIGSRNLNDDLTTHTNGTRYAAITAVSTTQVRVTGFLTNTNGYSDMARVSFAIFDS